MSNAASPRRDGIMHKWPDSVQLLSAQRIIHPTRTLRCCLFRNGFKVAKFECGRRRTYTSITTKSDPPAPSGRLVGGKDRSFFPEMRAVFRDYVSVTFLHLLFFLRQGNFPAGRRQRRVAEPCPEKRCRSFWKKRQGFLGKDAALFLLIPGRNVCEGGRFSLFLSANQRTGLHVGAVC